MKGETVSMQNLLQPIKTLLDMGVVTKSTYRAALEGLDLSMANALSSIGYDNTQKYRASLFVHTTDERLDMANTKTEMADIIPESALSEYVHYASDIMYKFLEYYYFGNLHEFYMSDAGMFSVEISCLLHTHGLGDNVVSAKKTFDNQLARLAENEITVIPRKGLANTMFLADTEANKKQIREILTSRGARVIKFISDEHCIRDITFTVKAEDMNSFVINEETSVSFETTDELNPDEIAKLQKIIKEIPFSLAFIKESPDMVQTCGYVAESNFAELCTIVDFNGEVRKRVNARHAAERAKNMSIHEIENNLGANFDPTIAMDAFRKLRSGLSHMAIENLHASVRNLRIERYGSVNVTMKISRDSDDLRFMCYDDIDGERVKPMSRERITNTFETVPDYINNLVYIHDVVKNKEAIEKILSQIPGIEVQRFTSARIAGYWYIESVDLVVNNIGAVIQYDKSRKEDKK